MFYMPIVFNYCLKEQKNKIDNIFFIKKTKEHFIWEKLAYCRFITGYFTVWMINFYSNLETIREKEQAVLYFEWLWALNLRSVVAGINYFSIWLNHACMSLVTIMYIPKQFSWQVNLFKSRATWQKRKNPFLSFQAIKWWGQIGGRMVTAALGIPCYSVPFLAVH